jgi:hypothetical protein
MKLNATVTFTFILLFLMLSAGLVSAFSGFAVGREALKGITQPDSRPNKGKAKAASSSADAKDGMALIREEDVVKSMKERIDSTAKGGGKGGKDDKNDDKKPDEKKPDEKKPDEKKADLAKFPIVSVVQGVSMEVVSTRRDGDATLLDLSMKNTGTSPVQFRYNFLTVTDEKGRVINAETIGLPAELTANSQAFSGSVKIATSSLQDVKTVTVQLSDYPEQKLQLRLADIPVQ